MRYLKILTIISYFILHPVLICQTNILRLEIQLQENKFLQSEPIYVKLRVTNLADSVVKTRRIITTDGNCKFIIKNKEGVLFPQFWTSPYPQITDLGLILQPNEEYEQNINILRNNGRCNQAYNDTVAVFDFSTITYFPIGNYTVAVLLETGQGQISSNTLTFEVIEPQGDDRKALQLLEQVTLQARKMDWLGATQAYETLIKKCSDSPYQVQAYRQLMNLNKYSESTEKQRKLYDTAIEFINMHPSSYAVTEAWANIQAHTTKIFKTPKGRKELLKYFLGKYPGTEIGVFAKKVLDQWIEQN